MPWKLVNGFTRWVDPYDESIVYASGLSSGSNITLPNSETYSDDAAKDLVVIFNDRVVEVTRDFTVVGSGDKTQIQTVYDLPNDTVVRFRKL